MNTDNQVRKETVKGPITVDSVEATQFQKPGTLTAQLRQVVTTISSYPSKKTSSSMQANIFDNGDFGFEDKVFDQKETRITWIPVPLGTTKEKVAELIKKHYENGACIYKVLSNKPILDENQKYAVNQGLRTMDDFANSQVVRFPDNEETRQRGVANNLVLDGSGNVQYRRTFFWKTPMDDQDGRNGDVYLSAEIKAELQGASALAGQTI